MSRGPSRRGCGGLALAAALLLGSSWAHATDDRRQAEGLLKDGSRLFAAGQYEKALDRFLAAYQIFPSPRILYNVAWSELHLGRQPEAAQHFHQFLKEAPPPGSDSFAQQAAEQLAALEKSVGRLRIRTDPAGATCLVDSKPAPGDVVYVRAGIHAVVATSSGKTAQTQVTVGAGEVQDVLLSLGSAVPAGQSRLDLRTDPTGAALRLDGTLQGPSPLVTDVPPGDHVIVAQLDGYAEASRKLSTASGTTTLVQLTLSPQALSSPPTLAAPPSASTTEPASGAASAPLAVPPTATMASPPAVAADHAWLWVVTGLTGGAAVAGGAGVGFGLAAQSASHDLTTQYHSEAQANSLVQNAKTREITANVLYAVAGAAAIAAATVFVVEGTF